MKGKHIIGLIAAVATITFLFRKTASSKTKVSSMFILGDSQTKRHIGEAFKDTFYELDVSYFGKEGATFLDYLNDSTMFDQLQCADIIYIQLGDNGIPNNEEKAKDFIKIIKQRCPSAIIYWAGPMKVTVPTIQSSYVNTTDTSSSRYIDTYNNTRRIWDNRLRTWLAEFPYVTHISNYELQESQPLDSAFSDRRGGDGVHLTKDSAIKLAEIIKDVIFQ
jgi:lysophospholipase L1-like esterase